MASSSEAFAKLETWRKEQTPLKVTVIEGGKTGDILTGKIAGIDPDASLVGVAIGATRRLARFNVEAAEFSIDGSKLVASKNESDWIVFEESH
jgi:hypothetical protein